MDDFGLLNQHKLSKTEKLVGFVSVIAAMNALQSVGNYALEEPNRAVVFGTRQLFLA